MILASAPVMASAAACLLSDELHSQLLPCLAQTLTASSAAAYAKPEHEDAQEFLSFLLVHTHEVRSSG